MVLLSSLSFRTNILKNIGVAWWPMRFQPHPPLNGSIHKSHCDWENIKKVAATVKIYRQNLGLYRAGRMQQPDHLNSVLRDSPHVWARDFLPSRSKPHSGNVWHADLGLWAQLQTGKWCGRALLPSNWAASATDFCSHATKFWRGVWQCLTFWSRTLPSQGQASSS